MERLTEWSYLAGVMTGYLKAGVNERNAFDLLAAYEDTGLEPEEVTAIKNAIMGQEIAKITEFDGISIQRLQEISKAEKDGRMVVLPCKVGAYVWVDGRKAIVEEFFGYKTERYLQAQFYDNMQYVDIPFEEIGKTVFLTREEADAALKKREEADNEAD